MHRRQFFADDQNVIDDTNYGTTNGHISPHHSDGTIESKATESTEKDTNYGMTNDQISEENISIPAETLYADLDVVLQSVTNERIPNDKKSDMLHLNTLYADVDAVLEDVAAYTDQEESRLDSINPTVTK